MIELCQNKLVIWNVMDLTNLLKDKHFQTSSQSKSQLCAKMMLFRKLKIKELAKIYQEM